MNKQSIIALTISGLLVTVLAPWLLKSDGGAADSWMGLDPDTRANMLMSGLAFVLSAIGLWVTFHMGRRAQAGAGQPRGGSAIAQLLRPKLRSTGSAKSGQELIDDLEKMVGLVPVLVELHSQIGHLSLRVVTRCQSFRRPNIISILLRRLYRRLSYLTDLVRDFRPGMHGIIPLFYEASRNQSASDVFEEGNFDLPAGLPVSAPNHFRLEGFEKALDRCVVITVALSAHGCC